ncbi:hypothetical protein K6U37_13970 [Vibrio parahaemolyticus]|uniref:hypothetical protein n=1 Tax=Vibrio parahaemolyticus TaxID=670 RepID=UPI001EEB567C|nr:hypothetical protein [Vibrio parahaemolyticus]MCG6464903.1 hypothetical protein [Vibrio parahaemolyticus]MCG6490046.1 hypothetical protein [Vibrio parahaemolyticus]
MKTFLVSTLAMMIVGCSDNVTTEYSTYAEAKDDNLFERGWLPDILPTSTINIEVTNDLDQNTSVGEFFIEKSAVELFLDKVEQTEKVNEYRFIRDGHQWIFTMKRDGLVTYRLDDLSVKH